MFKASHGNSDIRVEGYNFRAFFSGLNLVCLGVFYTYDVSIICDLVTFKESR